MTNKIIFTILLLTTLSTIVNGAVNCKKLNCASNNTPCRTYGCSSIYGCYYTEKCTSPDMCHDVSCNAATGNCTLRAINCDDGNSCTDDACHPGYGCYYTPNQCDPAAVCLAACNDNNPCTNDFCDFRNDCYHSEIQCSDHNACTLDSCGPNGCTHDALNCDDNDPCTADFCSTLYGCYHEPIECSIKVPCTLDSNCNRNNLCETYTCDTTTNTCDYYAKNCGGWPCINNQCTTGSISN